MTIIGSPVVSITDPPERIRAAWVANLRSGNYQQTTGNLRHYGEDPDAPEGFCCLGVLCDIVNPGGWFDGDDGPDHEHGDHGGTIDVDLLEAVGISGKFESALVAANDNGQDFADIADMIEALS